MVSHRGVCEVQRRRVHQQGHAAGEVFAQVAVRNLEAGDMGAYMNVSVWMTLHQLLPASKLAQWQHTALTSDHHPPSGASPA